METCCFLSLEFWIFELSYELRHLSKRKSPFVATFRPSDLLLALEPSLCFRLFTVLIGFSVIPSKYISSNGSADDSPAVAAAFARCSSDSVIVFSEGVDYNIFTPISAKNLSNVAIQMQGNLHLPQNVTAVQNLVNASNALTYSSALYWFTFAGPSIDYVGTSNVSNSWINSYGQAWWDANPVNGTGIANRPHLISFNTTNGSMSNFKSRKPIGWNVQLVGSNITIKDTIIDAYSTSGSFPFNTDGFDVTGTNIKIYNSVIFNGDDAIAVQSGSHNVLFQGGTIG